MALVPNFSTEYTDVTSFPTPAPPMVPVGHVPSPPKFIPFHVFFLVDLVPILSTYHASNGFRFRVNYFLRFFFRGYGSLFLFFLHDLGRRFVVCLRGRAQARVFPSRAIVCPSRNGFSGVHHHSLGQNVRNSALTGLSYRGVAQ